jgi:hypothetical protein
VCLRKVDRVDIAKELYRLSGLVVPDIADPLEEEERKDLRLPVRAIDCAAAKDLSAVPQMSPEVLEPSVQRCQFREILKH